MTRRQLLGVLLGLPAAATAAPASGFTVSGQLAMSYNAENEVTLGLVTLKVDDPLLLEKARDLIEHDVSLSLTRSDEVPG